MARGDQNEAVDDMFSRLLIHISLLHALSSRSEYYSVLSIQ